MPIYEALVAFAGQIGDERVAPAVGGRIQISEADAESLLKAGYIRFLEDDPFDPAVFDSWTLEDIQGATVGGDDGLIAYAGYHKIDLKGDTKKDDVLKRVVDWFNEQNPVESDDAPEGDHDPEGDEA